jgi:hypothetical protein
VGSGTHTSGPAWRLAESASRRALGTPESQRQSPGGPRPTLGMEAWDTVAMLKALVVSGALIAILAGACSSSSTSRDSTNGTLTGVLELESAVPGGSPQGIPGRITMQAISGTPRTATAGSDGKFSAEVPAGSYAVTGHSPMFIVNDIQGDCSYDTGNGSTSVKVTGGQTTSITLGCPTK